MPNPPPRRRVPSSTIASFIDPERLSKLLAPWVPDAEDRSFVLRCMLEEGPAHHRGANWIVLALLGMLLERAGNPKPPADQPTLPVPMRLPPHLARDHAADGEFPLRIPTRVLERLGKQGTPQFEAMVDCLTDGPPQHALANAATVCLLSVLLDHGERGGA
jgi:hypothetical protein